MELSTLRPGEVAVLTGAPSCGTTTLLQSLATQPGTDLMEAPPGEDWARDDVVTTALGAPHLAGREMGAMSSGERQRVRMARFLDRSADASVLLLDEPFGYLDARGITEVLAALRSTGKPVLLVCKGDERVHAAADRLLVLEDGKVSG